MQSSSRHPMGWHQVIEGDLAAGPCDHLPEDFAAASAEGRGRESNDQSISIMSRGVMSLMTESDTRGTGVTTSADRRS